MKGICGRNIMKKRILCFGDSNTWGAIAGDSERRDTEERWTGILQRELGDGYQVIEEGYNGRTTVFDDPVEGRLSGIRYFGPCLDTQSPLDLVILMLWTNDLKKRFGVSPGTIAFGLNRYLDVLAVTPMAGKKKPQVLIVSPLLISPKYKDHPLFHDMFGEDADVLSGEFAKEYKAFADGAGLEFLDAAAYAQAADEDGIHMTAESHIRLGEAMAEKVRELLE